MEDARVSNSGQTLLAFSAYDALQTQIQYYDSNALTPTINYLYGRSNELQDIPYAISMTQDGQYFAIGTWGNLTSSNPEVRVFSSKQSTPIYEFKAAGSVFDIDIATGVKDNVLHVAAGCKSTHANVMGGGGWLYYFEIPTKTKNESKV